MALRIEGCVMVRATSALACMTTDRKPGRTTHRHGYGAAQPMLLLTWILHFIHALTCLAERPTQG
jgi:hypothetical protein